MSNADKLVFLGLVEGGDHGRIAVMRLPDGSDKPFQDIEGLASLISNYPASRQIIEDAIYDFNSWSGEKLPMYPASIAYGADGEPQVQIVLDYGNDEPAK